MAISTVAWPVIRMTAAPGFSTRDRSRTSNPLTPGMTTSATMTSNSCSSIRVSASSPLLAVATWYPSVSRNVPRVSCVVDSSSTTRIDAVIA